MVYEISEQELVAADKYESSTDYRRISVTLNSGVRAWVYLWRGCRSYSQPSPRASAPRSYHVGSSRHRSAIPKVCTTRNANARSTDALIRPTNFADRIASLSRELR
jgi:hypothetical protein